MTWIHLEPATNVMFGFIGGGVALFVAIFHAWQVVSRPLDTTKKQTIRISNLIHAGAKAFLIEEYKALLAFVLLIFILLSALIEWETGLCYLAGAFLSATSGYVGMMIATKANVRTTLASQGPTGLNNGLQVAFKSGSVMALSVVGLGLLGLSALYIIFDTRSSTKVFDFLSGFAFGGSSVALFARVGGGIYTKAADVGADLVGKVEEELEEDSPDNPATIADNVGDNVGDVAGMGADLFESFVSSIIASITLGSNAFGGNNNNGAIALPFYIAGFGALASIAGTWLVRTDKSAVHGNTSGASSTDKLQKAAKESEGVLEALLSSIRTGIYGASFFVIIGTILALGFSFELDNGYTWQLFATVMMGLLCGNLIGYFTEYATSYTYVPTQNIARKSDTGPATVIIEGIGVGMLSTVPPVLFIVTTILGSYYTAAAGDFSNGNPAGNNEGVYGTSLAAVGMLSTLGVTLATDAFGPVADNAGGIAEMAPDDEIAAEVRETTDALDALGNTTAATGKGFAIGSAVLTTVALIQAYSDAAGISATGVNLLNPEVLPGVLIGALLPFLFAALTMLSVGKAAESIMWECRDQLNKKYFDNMALDPQRCVEISTVSSLKHMILPGTIAVFSPAIVGTLLGTSGLLGLLAGSTSSGFMLAVMMSNAGGAWDNAKKWVEKGNLGAGRGKKSDNHKAVVVGDTVGDPFKDTSGPALNILIKLMAIVALVLAPELDPKPFAGDRWWVALVILGGLAVLGSGIYFILRRFGVSHDVEAIVKRSTERKAASRAENGDHKADE